MKPMQSLSTQQYFTLNHIKYMSADGRYQKRYPNQKLLTQQSLCSTNPNRNTKTVTPEMTKNQSLMHDVTRSEQLINLHADFKDEVQRQNSIFKNRWNNKDSQVSIKHLREASNDMLAKKSVQILIGMQKGATKTQYSKINRRKEQLFKKSAHSEKEERNEHPIHKFQDFSQQKILEKYREMILRKEQGAKSFNMINKLYHLEALSSKQIVRSQKEAMKVIPTKSYQTRKNSQIEYKISKIITKPAEIKVVKEMLAFNYDNSAKASFREQKKEERAPKLSNKPQSQELNSEKRGSVVVIKKELNQKVEPSTPKISELRVKSNTGHKMEAINSNIKKYPSIAKQELKEQSKPQPRSEVKSQTQIIYPPPKKVTATAYIIYEILDNQKGKSPTKRTEFESIRKKDYPGKIHSSLNIKNASQIASLTKIMTCIVVIETCQRLAINPHTQRYKVGYFESSIKGTTAQIQPGDIYTIDQLLKGLMLPSGNDASLALARWAGNILLQSDPSISKSKAQSSIEGDPQTWAASNKYLRHKSQKLKPKRCYNRFIAEMNKKSRLLGLEKTSYMNSHGLSDPHNKSCCIDLAVLCEYALQNKYFCQIVSCKECKATIDREEVTVSSPKGKKGRMSRRKINREDPEQDNLDYDVEADEVWNKSDQEDNEDDESENEGPTQSTLTTKPSKQEKVIEMTTKQIHWVNTHKLLHNKEGYFGIKTGVTVTAGPCLASFYHNQGRKFVIIVLNSKKLSQRFTDTEILRHWLCKKERIGVCESKVEDYQ